jgi:tRNA-dihydrouridine synthase
MGVGREDVLGEGEGCREERVVMGGVGAVLLLGADLLNTAVAEGGGVREVEEIVVE